MKDDYISRKAAIEAVNGMPDCPNGYSDTYDKAQIVAVLEEVPTAQQGEINDFWVGFIYGAYVRGME